MENMYKRYDDTSTLQETTQKSHKQVDDSVELAKAALNDKTKSRKIRDLVHGWSYLVRIRGKNQSGWGEYSDLVKVSTKTIALKWYHNKHGEGITFINDKRCK